MPVFQIGVRSQTGFLNPRVAERFLMVLVRATVPVSDT